MRNQVCGKDKYRRPTTFGEMKMHTLFNFDTLNANVQHEIYIPVDLVSRLVSGGLL